MMIQLFAAILQLKGEIGRAGLDARSESNELLVPKRPGEALTRAKADQPTIHNLDYSFLYMGALFSSNRRVRASTISLVRSMIFCRIANVGMDGINPSPTLAIPNIDSS
jgi:hypothetical protein